MGIINVINASTGISKNQIIPGTSVHHFEAVKGNSDTTRLIFSGVDSAVCQEIEVPIVAFQKFFRAVSLAGGRHEPLQQAIQKNLQRLTSLLHPTKDTQEETSLPSSYLNNVLKIETRDSIKMARCETTRSGTPLPKLHQRQQNLLKENPEKIPTPNHERCLQLRRLNLLSIDGHRPRTKNLQTVVHIA